MHVDVRIHPTASVSKDARVGPTTQIWQHCQIREGASLGRECILGKGVYIDANVTIGDRVKIQNYVSVYEGVTIEDGVFCGPHCVFTNDHLPRAVTADGHLKRGNDWTITPTLVRQGAAIGANATIVCGVTIGAWAMVGAGAVVTRDVPSHGLVLGNPARLIGYVCRCGAKLVEGRDGAELSHLVAATVCPACGACVALPDGCYSPTPRES